MVTAPAQAETYDGSTPLDNDKQEQFCLEYLKDFNQTQAAIRAGYAKNRARITASELVTKGNVSLRLSHLVFIKQKTATKTADDIERELEKLAFSDITNVVAWNESGMCFIKNSDEIDPEYSAAIESVQVEEKAIGKEGDGGMVLKTKVKQHNKIKALELLGKHKGMFNDKVDLTLNGESLPEGIVINFVSSKKESE